MGTENTGLCTSVFVGAFTFRIKVAKSTSESLPVASCWKQPYPFLEHDLLEPREVVHRLAFYQALRLKRGRQKHLQKRLQPEWRRTYGGLCALEDSCLQVWAGKLTPAQSDYKSLTAKSEYLLPRNTTRWWNYFSSKARSPWARLSGSINPLTITQWREWSYTNLHWHSIWLLVAWETEVFSSVTPFACVQLAGYLLYPSYCNLWPVTIVLAQPASCTSVSL